MCGDIRVSCKYKQNVFQLWLFQVAKILYLFKQRKSSPFCPPPLVNGSIVFE